MAQTQTHEPLPVDVLQNTINSIVSFPFSQQFSANLLQLIEVGKVLRTAGKQGGRTLANSSSQLTTFLQASDKKFHEALDDIECDIVRTLAQC